MILLIDNYDSFTYNLYHYILEIADNKLDKKILVKKNDEVTLSEIEKLNPRAIIISPGPCSPSEAGICLELIKKFKDQYPMLGVCLGHQAIGQAFGAEIIKTYPRHGNISFINHKKASLFKDIPSPFKATRYHSLAIKEENCPIDLDIIATTDDKSGKIIMAIKHKKYKIFGVQFHPEAIASEYGHQIIKNFLKAN